MGRSTTSCFKIITCGSDSVDRDDLQVSETKASTDKRGWSFRKRSARHRVLSNTVISEAPSSVNKESPESAGTDYQMQAKAAIPEKSSPEKSSEMQWTDEMAQLSTSINAKFPESIALAEAETELVVQPDESVVTVIQSAIRKFLAEKELLKQKNIVKLQAAVRGHLVRRHAVGSLRCVQAIIKMQVLVRARHSRVSALKSTNDGKLDVNLGKDNRTQKEARKLGANPDIAYTSIEKLLSNRFARQLLESSPKSKSMNIKCDSSRRDSAWKWLERWVSVSPKEIEQSVKSEPNTELNKQEGVKHPKNQVETICPDEEDSASVDLRSSATLAAVPYLNSVAVEAALPSENLVSQKLEPSENLVSQKLEQPNPENSDLSKSTENSHQLLIEDKPAESITQTELNYLSSKPELNYLSSKPELELEADQPKRSMKRVASEQPETEGQRLAFGSRKASNTAFIAAQSKFEELTSTSNSAKSITISNQENEVESCENTVSSSVENTIKTRDTNLADYAASSASKVLAGGSECGTVLAGGSECGTELSISSTLDSPDQSEVGAVEQEVVNVSDEGVANSNNTTYIDVEPKVDNPIIHDTDLSNPSTIQSEKLMNDKVAIAAESSMGEKFEENASNMQIKSEHETIDKVYKSSPGASPRSRVTVQEFQTTPSSEVSTKSRKTRHEKNGSSQKRKSLSVGKQSPVPSNDSGVRRSLEQLPKDLKAGKRRNSFGLPKSDDVHQEPRDSSSSHSLPSYMQATESARAKAYANVSPRSSPDVQEKESYIKKRHSLPGANGRQGSPRIQRSMSQAQQSAKGNGNNPPQERKWQR